MTGGETPPGSSGGSTFTGYYPPGTVADLSFTVEYKHPVTGEPRAFTRTLIGKTIGNYGPTATADVTQVNDGPWEVKVHLKDDDSELIFAKPQQWTPEQWFWGSLYGSSTYPSSFVAVEGTLMGNDIVLGGGDATEFVMDHAFNTLPHAVVMDVRDKYGHRSEIRIPFSVTLVDPELVVSPADGSESFLYVTGTPREAGCR